VPTVVEAFDAINVLCSLSITASTIYFILELLCGPK
jgi:hypothetical protein